MSCGSEVEPPSDRAAGVLARLGDDAGSVSADGRCMWYDASGAMSFARIMDDFGNGHRRLCMQANPSANQAFGVLIRSPSWTRSDVHRRERSEAELDSYSRQYVEYYLLGLVTVLATHRTTYTQSAHKNESRRLSLSCRRVCHPTAAHTRNSRPRSQDNVGTCPRGEERAHTQRHHVVVVYRISTRLPPFVSVASALLSRCVLVPASFRATYCGSGCSTDAR